MKVFNFKHKSCRWWGLWGWICGSILGISAENTPINLPKVAVSTNSTNLEGQGSQEARVMVLHHARHFTLTATGQGWRVDILSPWPNSQEKFSTLLWPKGEALPPENPFPVIRIPVERVAVQSTTSVGLLEVLEAGDKIVAVADGQYIQNPALAKAYREGQIKELGVQGQLNIEALLDLQPDVVLTYALNAQDTPYLQKLQRAKIPHLVIGSFTESTALARAEWMVLLGVLLGKNDKAMEVFFQIEKNYLDLCLKIQNMDSNKKPKVFFNLPFGGTWYMPQGQNWMVKLILDAGAQYPWQDFKGEGSLPLPAETIYDKALDADIWINPSQDPNFTITTLVGLDRRYGEFKAVQTRKCLVPSLQVNEVGGNNFFEWGAARPDLVLADLIYYLHPEILPEHQPVFYQWMPSSH